MQVSTISPSLLPGTRIFQGVARILWIVLFPIAILGQTRNYDRVMEYSIANEYLFWHQVSLFYPWTKEQIKKYQDQLSPNRLASNVNIKWSAELIRSFPDWWNIDLVINSSVPWDQTMIEEFHKAKWFDWQYITHNKRKVRLSLDFYVKHKQSIPEHIRCDTTLNGDSIILSSYWEVPTYSSLFRGYFNDHDANGRKIDSTLIPSANTEISMVAVDTLFKYAKWINWFRLSRCTSCYWTFEEIELLFPFLKRASIVDNKMIYDTLFSGILNDEFIETVSLHHFPKEKIRFFEWIEGKDDIGTLPSIIFNGDRLKSFGERMKFGPSFPDTLIKSKYILKCIYDPPTRFADVLKFFHSDYQNAFTPLFISSRTRQVLEKAKLPAHRFYPITVYIDDHWYGQDTMSYHILLLDNSPEDEIIQDSLYLSRWGTMYEERISRNDTKYTKFYSAPSYQWFRDSVVKTGIYENIEIPKVYLQEWYDLFTFQNGTIYISPRLKEALEAADITGVDFKNQVLRPIVYIDEKKSPSKPVSVNPELLRKDDLGNQRTVNNYRKIVATRDSILSVMPVVDSLYNTKPFPNYVVDERHMIQRDSLLRQKEIDWDVILPYKYRLSLITGKLPELGPSLNDYRLYSIENLTQFDASFYNFQPLLVKGITIASNGDGEFLCLLLEKGSTYQISPMLVKIMLGTSDVTPLFDIRDRIK